MPKNIQSVQRAIDIINCVCTNNNQTSLKKISEDLNLNINTTRGLIQTLVSNGFLSCDVNQNYSLGYEFFNKYNLLYQSQISNIRNIAMPQMQKISKEFNVSIWLQYSFHTNIYTIETVDSPSNFYSYAPKSGANLPLHASASGKILLTYLPKTRQTQIINQLDFYPFTKNTIVDKAILLKNLKTIYSQGYALETEEIDLGVSSIAVGFFDFNDNLLGTLSVAVPTVKFEKILSNLIPALTEACYRISDLI